MALDTYSNLKSEIETYMVRDDLTSQIDTFIDLAEAKHKREIRFRPMLKRCQANLSTTTRYLALPAGFLEMVTIRLLTAPLSIPNYCNLHEINRRYQSASGRPRWFTIHEEIEFERIADSAYTAEMILYSALTPLSSSATTNALLTFAPDLYLYGALLAAEPYLMNDERLPMWRDLYNEARTGLQRMDKRSRTVGPTVARVSGDTP